MTLSLSKGMNWYVTEPFEQGGAPGKAEAVPEQRKVALVVSVPTLGRSTMPLVPWPAKTALLDRPTLTSGVNGNPVRALIMFPTHQPRRNLAGSRSEGMVGIWYRRFICQLWRRSKQEGPLSMREFNGLVPSSSA